MGTPPAHMWAMLYFSPHEKTLLHKYLEYLLFYKRFIDDRLGIWNWTGTPACTQAWSAYEADVNVFGQLRWEWSPLSKGVNFLDLTLTIDDRRISYTLFEKILNLYLYLPPTQLTPMAC